MMAEKSGKLVTMEDKIIQAKELFNRGSRNYLVKLYNEAADDLSQVCNTYEEVYGQLSDELGMPYLLYAKTLIALAQDENKVLSVPDEQEDDDDDDDEDEEEENTEKDEEKAEKGDANGDAKIEEQKPGTEAEEEVEKKEKDEPAANGTEEAKKETTKTNGETKTDEVAAKTAADATSTAECEPGTSNGTTVADGNEENEDDEAAANLQVAWEILELAVKIFERQGEPSLANLAEAFSELAGISFENSHFEAAISDFKKSLDIHMKLPDDNRRIVAEIYYKIGLAYLMQNGFDDCIQHLRKASELIDEEIEEEKQKENQTEKQKQNIKGLEETKQDILMKITEVEETKIQSIEEVRNELTKLISTDPKVADDAGTSSTSADVGASSSSTSAEKQKPTDITHLIKRKKPDSATENDVESSPAKRAAV